MASSNKGFFDLATELQYAIFREALVHEEAILLTLHGMPQARQLNKNSDDLNLIRALGPVGKPIRQIATQMFLSHNIFGAVVVATDDGILAFIARMHRIGRLMGKIQVRHTGNKRLAIHDIPRLELRVHADEGPSVDGYSAWIGLFLDEQHSLIHRQTHLRYVDAGGAGAPDRQVRRKLQYLQESIHRGAWQDQPQGARAKMCGSSDKRKDLVTTLLDGFHDVEEVDQEDEQEAFRFALALRPVHDNEVARFWDKAMRRIDGVDIDEDRAWSMLAEEWVEDDCVREAMALREQEAAELRW